MIETYTDGGVLTDRWTADGYERYEGGQLVETRPLTSDEQAMVDTVTAQQASLAAAQAHAQARTDAVAQARAKAEPALTSDVAEVRDLAQALVTVTDLLTP